MLQRNRYRRGIVGLVSGMGLLLSLWTSPVRAQFAITEDLTVTGFAQLRYTGNLVGPSEQNPNNAALWGNNDINVNAFRPWLQFDVTYHPSPKFSLFARARAIGDYAADIDEGLPHFDAFPIHGTPGRTLPRISSRNEMGEISELFSDINLGDWWFRVGKQIIQWGQVPAERVLDVINPLDRSWWFFTPGGEFSNDVLIAEWMLRGVYTTPQVYLPRWLSELTFDMVINPGHLFPLTQAAPGSPYRLIPSFVRQDRENMMGRFAGGIQVSMVDSASRRFTLNFYSQPDQFGVPLGGKARLIPNDQFGVPLLARLGDFTRYISEVPVAQPRTNAVGGSFNFFNEQIGAVIAGEGIYIIDQPFLRRSTRSDVVQRGQWASALWINRPTRFFPHTILPNATDIALFWVERIRAGGRNAIIAQNKYETRFILSVGQLLYHQYVNPSFLLIYDVRDAILFQPGLQVKFRQNWFIKLWYNYIDGSARSPAALDSLRWMREVGVAVIYNF